MRGFFNSGRLHRGQSARCTRLFFDQTSGSAPRATDAMEAFPLLVSATREMRPCAPDLEHRHRAVSRTDPPPGRSPTDRFRKLHPCRENAPPAGQYGFAVTRICARAAKLKQCINKQSTSSSTHESRTII